MIGNDHSDLDLLREIQIIRGSPMNSPLVDVILMTYNHEPFIEQAIESVLTQGAGFKFRLVILEDFSSDGTRQIVRRYAANHPNKIKLILNDTNLCSNIPFMKVVADSAANYIALLDGDDYWIDSRKLERQVNFLEANPECAICYHNVHIIYDDGRQSPHLKNSTDQPQYATIHDLFVRCFIATCSVMYRRSALHPIPGWYADVLIADDWNLHLLAARSGLIGYIADAMGVYRIHKGGVWSGMSDLQQWQKALTMLEEMFSHFDQVYHPDIQRGLVNVYQYLAKAQAGVGDLRGAVLSLANARAIEPTASVPVNITRITASPSLMAGVDGIELSLHCENALPTSFVVVNGTPLATYFRNPSVLEVILPASLFKPSESYSFYVQDLNGGSNRMQISKGELRPC